MILRGFEPTARALRSSGTVRGRSEKVISSIDDGVNLAIEMLLNENKKELYRQALKEAASDNDFLERTLECQKEFDEIGF